MKFVFIFLSSIILFPQYVFSVSLDGIATQWQSLLDQNISMSGGVNYIGFSKNEKLDHFLSSYQSLDVSALTSDERKAAYINLYNAFMIKSILRYANSQKIPVNSKKFLDIKINDIDIPGGNIWNGDYKINLNGKNLNLDEIEHKLIRGVDSGNLKSWAVDKLDPRIHAAVNCAAISCPRIREVAYTAKNINRLLDENMKEYLSNDKLFSKVASHKMQANSIVFWYYGDFDDYAQDVLKLDGAGDYFIPFISKNAKDAKWKRDHFRNSFNDKSRFSLKLSSSWDFQYNWKINDKRNFK